MSRNRGAVERMKIEICGITVPGIYNPLPAHWLRLNVYERREDLCRDLARHNGMKYTDEMETAGAFRAPARKDPTGDPKTTPRYLGMLRLCREHLDVNVLAHESVHVAVEAAKLHYDVNNLVLTHGFSSEREEVVAYIAGSLTAYLVKTLLPSVA